MLDAIYEEDNFDNDDVEMVDVEEGELVGDHRDIKNDPARPVVDGDGDAEVSKQEEQSKNRRRRANKKKNRKRKRVAPGSGPDFTDINRSRSRFYLGPLQLLVPRDKVFICRSNSSSCLEAR